MRHLVLGTAGHIDHGKSSLVEALTGVNPDRLKEEKLRGITIELGFADLDLDPERTLSLVDVPGHERFVRHMVAGATGIDAVLLVVAADQGVQPQTREHLQICALLGVARGVIALTKCDLVDDELAEVVALETHELVTGTFLESAALVPVSARTGRGMDPLRGALAALFDTLPERPADGLPRLPVDRSFVLKGFGTVVTGTLVSGTLREGDEVEVLPGGRRGRIRGLQVHRRKSPVVVAGRRTAVNLQGLDCADVPRGSTLTRPGALPQTRRALARLTLLADAPATLAGRGGPVRFHQGTADRGARLHVLDRGEDGVLHAELHLDEPTVLVPGDRFILRRPAPLDTLGGGVIVDVEPPRRREIAEDAFDRTALDPERAVCMRLQRAAARGRGAAELAAELGIAAARIDGLLAGMAQAGRVVRAAQRWYDGGLWRDLAERLVQALDLHHVARPLEPGASREALRAELCPALPQEAWRELLAELERSGGLRLEGEIVALTSHSVVLQGPEQALAEALGARFRAAGLEPPELSDVAGEGDPERVRAIIEVLVARGELVRIQDRRLFHSEALADLRVRLRKHAAGSRFIDVGEFKELAGVTRKNAIPLLEQLDAERSTRRVGDRREILI